MKIKFPYAGDKGYTLLFAVIVSTLVLAIGISILGISKKEFLLSSASRDSRAAFYAADSGIECAVYADSHNNAFSTSTDNLHLGCSSTSQIGSPVGIGNGALTGGTYGPALFKFDIKFGNLGGSCTHVEVSKKYTVNGFGVTTGPLVTTITSYGYNLGWVAGVTSDASSCSGLSPKKVERAIQLTY